MPGWKSVLEEIEKKSREDTPIDWVRRKYLKNLSEYTGRNVIAYYSGWLQHGIGLPGIPVNDADINSLMSAVHQLDRSKGLDLILHTPGGDIGATENFVKYLWKMFNKDIRVIVPQIAMSAGTMIACASKEIIMGKQSSLGPIDPQIYGMPAEAVLEEFQMAANSIKQDPATTPLWQALISKYHPTLLVECAQAITLSREMVHRWLCENMFEEDSEKTVIVDDIMAYLSSHAETKTHSRHICMEKCESLKLRIRRLEDDDELQDLVLTVHHAYMHTFSMFLATKIIENQLGVASVTLINSPSSRPPIIPNQAMFPWPQPNPDVADEAPPVAPTDNSTDQ